METNDYYVAQFLTFLNNNPILIAEILSGLIPIILLLFSWKVSFLNSFYLSVYAISIFLFESINNYFSLFHLNNHKIYLIFYILETTLLYLYYLKEFENVNLIKWLSPIIVSIVFLFFRNLFFNKYMDEVAGSAQSLGFIVLTVIVFYFILNSISFKSIFDSSLFWVNVGNLFYFSGKLFVFTIINIVNNPNTAKEITNLWLIVSVLLIFQRICIGIAIYKLKFNKVNLIEN